MAKRRKHFPIPAAVLLCACAAAQLSLRVPVDGPGANSASRLFVSQILAAPEVLDLAVHWGLLDEDPTLLEFIQTVWRGPSVPYEKSPLRS